MRTYHEIIKKEICYNEIIRDERILTSPSAKQMADGLIQQSDGSLMVSFKLEPDDMDLFGDMAVKRRDAISDFFGSLTDGIEADFEWIRRRDGFSYISCENAMSGSAREIEMRRRKSFESSSGYADTVFMTIVKRPRLDTTLEDLDELVRIVQMLKASLSGAGCSCRMLKGGELASFLKFSMDLEDVKLADFDCPQTLSDALLTQEYCLKSVPLSIGSSKQKHVLCLTVTALPSCTQPDLFSFCSWAGSEFRIVLKYRPYGRVQSEKVLEHKRKSFKNSLFSITKYVKGDLTGEDVSDEFSHFAMTGKEQADSAMKTISEKGWGAGLCQASICLWDQDEDSLERRAERLKGSFQRQGLLLKAEGVGNSLCFLSMICGAKRLYAPLFVLSENFADLMHLSVLSKGPAHSRLLEERTGSQVPFIYVRNTDGSVRRFFLWGEDGMKGHTFITGPTGSGKSALLSLFAAQWLKYPGTRAVVIDSGLSSYRLVKENGGDFHYPLADNTRFQPLRNAEENMAGCLEFIKSVCWCHSINFGAAEQQECSQALRLLEKGRETITALYHVVKGRNRDSRILPALAPYACGGEYSSLFDNDIDSLIKLERLTMIETGKALSAGTLEKGVAIPFFVYLLSRLDRVFDDCVPTLLIIDEGWRALKNEVFSRFFEEWIKTLRKKNTDVVLSVTNLQDIIGTRICETVMSNTQTRIFFKDANAESGIERDSYRSAGLDDKLISILPRLPDFCPLVVQGRDSAIVDFDMRSQIDYLITPEQVRKRLTSDD